MTLVKKDACKRIRKKIMKLQMESMNSYNEQNGLLSLAANQKVAFAA